MRNSLTLAAINEKPFLNFLIFIRIYDARSFPPPTFCTNDGQKGLKKFSPGADSVHTEKGRCLFFPVPKKERCETNEPGFRTVISEGQQMRNKTICCLHVIKVLRAASLKFLWQTACENYIFVKRKKNTRFRFSFAFFRCRPWGNISHV